MHTKSVLWVVLLVFAIPVWGSAGDDRIIDCVGKLSLSHHCLIVGIHNACHYQMSDSAFAMLEEGRMAALEALRGRRTKTQGLHWPAPGQLEILGTER
jgi:hypothetical protein